MGANQKITATKVVPRMDFPRKVARFVHQRLQPVTKLLKFWGHDIWAGQWDHDRRALLLKHYWSYFRFSPIPTDYVPEPSAGSGSEKEQIVFSSAFRNTIEYVQSRPTGGNGVYLTFRPIGKNLRLLATAVRDNADCDRRTYIRSGGPPTEECALSEEGRQWCPWVWSRTADYPAQTEDERRDTAKAWNIFFKNPSTSFPIVGRQERPQVPRLGRSVGPFRSSYLKRVLENAAALTYVFSPVDSILDQLEFLKQEMQWPEKNEPVLGVHIRRGDAAQISAEHINTLQKATRKSFHLTEYLDAVDVLCSKYHIRHIYLATESIEEIERAKHLRPQYTFLFLKHDRSIFPNIATSNQFIEYMAFDHPERVRALTMSAILDLCFFRECHAFIGTFNSEFSILAWLLVVGSRGHLVPYISLSKPLQQRSLDPFKALLNITNNCPLELYHW